MIEETATLTECLDSSEQKPVSLLPQSNPSFQETASSSLLNTASSLSADSRESDTPCKTITPRPFPSSLTFQSNSAEREEEKNTELFKSETVTEEDLADALSQGTEKTKLPEEAASILPNPVKYTEDILSPRNFSPVPVKKVKCELAVLFNLIAKAVLNWVAKEGKLEEAKTDFIHAKKLTATYSEYYNFIEAIQKNLAKYDAAHTRKVLLTIADICFALYKKELIVNEISISLLNMASRCIDNAKKITKDKELLKSIKNDYCMLVAHLESAQQIFNEITLLSPLLTRRNEIFDNTILAIIYSIYKEISRSALLFDRAKESQNRDSITFITQVKTQCRRGKHSLALLNVAKYYLYNLNFLLETKESNQIIAMKCLELAIKINPSNYEAFKLSNKLRCEEFKKENTHIDSIKSICSP